MSEILAWGALIILVVAVWLLAGRYSRGGAPDPTDEFRGPVV